MLEKNVDEKTQVKFHFKKTMKKFTLKKRALILMAFFLGQVVYADPSGRYVTSTHHIPIEQRDVFMQTIHLHFDSDVKTIGDAVGVLLKLAGYTLAPSKNSALTMTLSKPLPLIQRELHDMTLKEALHILVGESFRIQQNPINRTVDFKVRLHGKVIKIHKEKNR